MKLGAIRHPKTLDLASRLRVKRPTVLGYLELLWAFAAEFAPEGNVGKHADGAIAGACDWDGEATTFVTALVSAGFLDRDPEHRLIVHDWHDHAPRWVLSKLSRAGQAVLCAAQDDSSTDHSKECSADCSVDCTDHSVSQAKPSQAKPSEEGADAPRACARGRSMQFDPTTTPGLDLPAWNRFLEYRAAINKRFKPISLPSAARKLAAFGADQAAVVEQSIANGWEGLFEIKRTGPIGVKRKPLMTAEEAEAMEASRAAS